MPGRKKYGYLLLLFLVLSGLAGTPTNNSLSKKERKFAADYMKETKSELQTEIKGLNNAQLNYKPAAEKRSIRESILSVISLENNVWNILETTMKLPANPEKRNLIKVSDEEIIKMIEDKEIKLNNFKPAKSINTKNKNLEEELSEFKSVRAEHIKYIKATTEDLRNHVIKTSFGWVDGYQLCLFLSAYTDQHIRHIRKIKADPGFPK